MSGQKVTVKNADMSEAMQLDATEVAQRALDQFSIEKEVAAFIKKEFDQKYNPTWHCIVGTSFGSFVTHESKHFIYFYVGDVGVLLFKTS